MKKFVLYIIFIIFVLTAPYFNKASFAETLVIATFESLGLYWSPPQGGTENECKVEYRVKGSESWKTAQSLWFDDRNNEYRGSIIGLTSNTTYDIKLTLLNTQTEENITAKTWNESFPIASAIYLPEISTSTLTIDSSGTKEGYILYTHSPGETASIDVGNSADQCINISPNVHHVIIRGVTLKGARKNGIRLYENVHDVVIEESDVSGWGDGANYQSAVFAQNGTNVERIIIQRNRLHHPRSNSNSWASGHPHGPQAISLFNTKGNLVIRYNEIYSDEGHYFNDGMGAGSNHSEEGFPNRDSDIYGNMISNAWDDGIESEGANRNVRIWGNYINKTYVKIAIASTAVGPIYIFRNIADTSRYNDSSESSDDYGRGPFIKAGEGGWAGGSGRSYIYHNTILQEYPKQGETYTLGCSGFIIDSGGSVYQVISRNNIVTNWKTWWPSYKDGTNSCTNDWDYDLYVGTIASNCSSRPHQTHGINMEPIYDIANKLGEYALKPGTNGFDAGVIIPNFNDNFHGNGPDMGAIEAGASPVEFGVGAYHEESFINNPKNLRIKK